jgi:3-methylcrotonyl-CoA carboxylase alpha subunit
VFGTILIANRGEIACRVIRTARRLGVRTIAVYSEADAGSQHVALADEAHLIGPAPARQSYLNAHAVLAAARAGGAEALHPGYGFLAENADFAEACAAAGIAFIGPPATAIRAMGSKSAAKATMEGAGVPIVPGYHGADQSAEVLAAAAREIGYPVLIKAAAGGGGKGMRLAEDEADFEAGLAAAKRESKAAFGDDQMLIERYLERPRHIEIQVFADNHGNAVHLFERDCSIQRRHQKVIEEAPAPDMPPKMRARMGEAAVAAARAIDYVGAGTVEFIVDAERGLDPDSFFFMEMNTRLQVEHPVTEMITGQDLVEWQLRVAAGETLPRNQDELAIDGHAIEVRLYAEDPARDFLPQTGRLSRLRFPDSGPQVRIDTGVEQGDEVSIHYDPMIAKLITWDRDRPAALRRLRAALDRVEVAGLTTNLAFLAAAAAHPAFGRGDVDTGFIDRHYGELVPDAKPATDRVLAIACLDVLLRRKAAAEAAAQSSHDPYAPWNVMEGWRLNDEGHDVLRFVDGGEDVAVTVHFRGGDYVLELPGGTVQARGQLADGGELKADLEGVRLSAAVVHEGHDITVVIQGATHRLTVHEVFDDIEAAEAAGATVTAPMPGKIVDLLVPAGSEVERGAPLLIMEAMKMEHTIVAPTSGTLTRFNFEPGEQVDEGAELLVFEPSVGE